MDDDAALEDVASAEGFDDPQSDTTDVEEIVDDVIADIQHGQIDEDVTTVLEERLEQAGIHVRPEEIDTLADEIENDASR